MKYWQFAWRSLLCVGLLGPTAIAFAQQGEAIEEIVVTGSYIKGTPEDAELPVDVISRADLEDQGSPTVIEMVRNLGVTAANLGETNQFTTGGQANEGVATVNLRGLGASRTLVLVNGRRHVSTELSGVDLNVFPTSAIGRFEILKDGAAALYGSDAVGGVVNVFTREDFRGVELGGNYQDIKETSGDWNLHGIFGTGGERWNWSIAAEYGERGELKIRERDWALVNTDENRPGGWSGIANPANIVWTQPTAANTVNVTIEEPGQAPITTDVAIPEGTSTGSFPDRQCENLGVIRAFEQSCGFQYAYFDNLIEKTEQTKIFTELNIEFGEGHRLHFEALYADVDLPAWKTSPSYPPQSLFGPDRVVLSDHPGLVDYNNFYGISDAEGAVTPGRISSQLNTGAEDFLGRDLADGATVTLNGCDGLSADECAASLASGDPYAIPINRAMGVIGVYGTGEPESARRRTETYRFAAGIDGSLFENMLDYNMSVSWSQQDRFVGGNDMLVERMALALRGYGGPDCVLPSVEDIEDGVAVPGTNGCEYYNPFSRALPGSVINDATNPDYNPAVANSEDLLRWLIEPREWDRTNELLVFDGVFSGMTGLELGGGNMGWAAGFQVRRERYDSNFGDVSNRAVSPCPWTLEQSVALGFTTADQLSPNCSSRTGPAAFLAASDEEYTSRRIHAFFGELSMPVTEDLQVQLAVRYEDYGGAVGSTVDPRLAASWRATENLSFRGSVSTTFRGPPQSILGGTGTALSFVGPTGAFKAIDTNGNPDIGSESAFASNLGVIFQGESYYASLDWWRFDFDDSFQTESFNDIVTAYYTTYDCDAGGVAVSNADCNALRSHIFPVAAHTNAAAIERIDVNWINGENIKTSGFDFFGQYDFGDVLGGVFTLGAEGTYVLEYKRANLLDINGVQLAEGGDLVGFLNYNQGPSFTSKPELKMNAFARFDRGGHNVSVIARYVDSYKDAGAPADLEELAVIDDHLTWDAHYIFRGFDNLVLSLSLLNFTDEDPPAARGDLNYDPFTHNPFGRMIKVGATYTFDL